ncbi:MAG: L-serine ammonia-lyase, iron-sulfur-dependent, subunit alpha [Rubripirellula sp.]
MIVSIFNDVVGPVMRGPSSSHCAAALRIGRLARDLMGGQITRVDVDFDTGGSLPATHQSQGSDMGLFGGLLGWEAADDRLPDSARWLAEAGIELEFCYSDLADPHPNTYRLKLTHQDTVHRLVAISTGGGMIEVLEIDGAKVSIGGDYDETLIWLNENAKIDVSEVVDRLHVDDAILMETGSDQLLQIRSQAPISDERLASVLPADSFRDVCRMSAVLPVRSSGDLRVPFQTCSEMMQHDGDRATPLWKLAMDYETARSGLSEQEVIDKMVDIVQIVRKSIAIGLAGTEYEDRVLGFQSGGFATAMQQGRLLDGGVLNKIVLYTTALMEVKSSMGVIVAAPTAGACAAFPATCLAIGEAKELADEEIAEGMLAGGLIGVFIASQWSFAAEVGGCQAEGGSAAAMSAAALVHFAGGSLGQSTGAASMAMQNMLGLICDPVANRVEVPCLGKNVLAASNALSCANMMLAGFDAVIPMDETIGAARAVAERMPREHRCTALGGLAITPTSKAIEARLSGCGSCGCGPSVVSPSLTKKD